MAKILKFPVYKYCDICFSRKKIKNLKIYSSPDESLSPIVICKQCDKAVAEGVYATREDK